MYIEWMQQGLSNNSARAYFGNWLRQFYSMEETSRKAFTNLNLIIIKLIIIFIINNKKNQVLKYIR